MAAGLLSRVIPENPRTALLVGAVIGFVANILLAIPSASDTDSGFVFLLLLPILTINGAILWFLLSKLIYGDARRKWLYVLLMIVLAITIFGPSPFVLLLSLLRQGQAHIMGIALKY